MALRLNTTGEYVKRTTNLVALSTNYAFCCWFKPSIATPSGGSYRTVAQSRNAAYTKGWWMGSSDGANTFYLNVYDIPNGVDVSSTPVAVSVGVWHHFAYVRTGTNQRMFIDGIQQASFTASLAGGGTPDVTSAGDDDLANNWTGNDLQYAREWNAFLSQSEIRRERWSATQVRTSNRVIDTPLTTDAADDSPNGYHWTEVGSVTYDATNVELPGALPYTQDFESGTLLAQLTGVAEYAWVENTSGVGVGGGYGVQWVGGGNHFNDGGLIIDVGTGGTTEGSVSFWMKFDGVIDDDNGYWPLIQISGVAPASGFDVIVVLVNGLNSWTGTSGNANDIYVGLDGFMGEPEPDVVRIGSAAEIADGNFHHLRLCWRNNAFVRFMFDDQVVIDFDATLYTVTTSWRGVSFGYWGFAGGVIDNIEVRADASLCGAKIPMLRVG